MRKTMMVWSACAAAIVPACLAGTAMADGVPVQGVGQLADSAQSAQSSATSTQTNPTNNAISVAILSPGAKTGDVSQANNSTANSTASNSNSTAQNAAQAAGGAAQQLAGQAAGSAQGAASSAQSNQYKPTNNAINVAILSPHASSGKVDQANNSNANSTASNENATDQNAAQTAGGHGGGGVQGIGQAAGNHQDAQSSAESTQTKPTNNAISLSILSPHSSTGAVHQVNNSTANSTASNENSTDQNAAQSAGGHGPEMVSKDAAPRTADGCGSCAPEPPKDGCDSCHPDIPGVQGIGQLATNDQSAQSSAVSTQTNPTNNAVSLSILSPGSYTGPVSQQNNSTANSTASNSNATTQNAAQALGGWGGGVQGIGQAAFNKQAAASSAASDQWCPTNFALGGGGSTGPVDQANNSTANSTAHNDNSTYQNALQSLGAHAWVPVKVF